MSEGALIRLASAAGLSVKWIDAHGHQKVVTPDTLRAVLARLGYGVDSEAQIAESHAEIREAAARQPKLAVVRGGALVRHASKASHVRLLPETGDALAPIALEDGHFRAPSETGYYAFEEGDGGIAVAPPHAKTLEAGIRLWGIAVQLYGLNGHGEIGDFGTLADFVDEAASVGADAVAISPVHALFGADPAHYSPYSPSSRLFLNPLYIATPDQAVAAVHKLIDWPGAAASKLNALHSAFEHFEMEGVGREAFAQFVRDGGPRLLAHARFEVLDKCFRPRGLNNWRDWPADWRDPSGVALNSLAPKNHAVAFELFLQWRAHEGMAAAQARAKSAGTKIGLIVDMAVGVNPAGSLAWSSPGELLEGLNVGAPPDIFNPGGQDWGITTFSPFGLRASGYDGFIATLRNAMRNAGGMRVDHAMGLRRLWVVPQGASAADGVYLDYPMRDLIGLVALESVRNDCAVVAEDLGTVPAGFRKDIARAHLYGMRVLWFERDANGAFVPPESWDRGAAALSTTHDLPTIAGWWSGHDIEWRRKLGASKRDNDRAKTGRTRDRRQLWKALKQAKCVKGNAPAPASASSVIDASLEFLAQTPSPLVIVAAEDMVGTKEQPNLPGTIDEHPNWRRILPDQPIFSRRHVRKRAAILSKGRRS